VSIMGSIKTFGGKRHISATHIRLITNHDEVYHHLLKALYISLNFRYPYGGVSCLLRSVSPRLTICRAEAVEQRPGTTTMLAA